MEIIFFACYVAVLGVFRTSKSYQLYEWASLTLWSRCRILICDLGAPINMPAIYHEWRPQTKSLRLLQVQRCLDLLRT